MTDNKILEEYKELAKSHPDPEMRSLASKKYQELLLKELADLRGPMPVPVFSEADWKAYNETHKPQALALSPAGQAITDISGAIGGALTKPAARTSDGQQAPPPITPAKSEDTVSRTIAIVLSFLCLFAGLACGLVIGYIAGKVI